METPSRIESGHGGEDRTAAIRQSLLEACQCAKIADDFRAQDVIVLDLTAITPIFDFFVLTTGTSRRQMHAIAEEINRFHKKISAPTGRGMEGFDNSQWIVEDYGDVVVHVFSPEMRELYNLESLWADAVRVDWQAVLKERDGQTP